MYHNLSCLSSIYFFSVRRPISIPSSVKLISIIKTDPLNRFVLLGDGNIAKVRFNMKTDPDQESLWVAKWRDDIAAYIMKQQWSSPLIGMWYHLLFFYIILCHVMTCPVILLRVRSLNCICHISEIKHPGRHTLLSQCLNIFPTLISYISKCWEIDFCFWTASFQKCGK